jgi:hypothetical protein
MSLSLIKSWTQTDECEKPRKLAGDAPNRAARQSPSPKKLGFLFMNQGSQSP